MCVEMSVTLCCPVTCYWTKLHCQGRAFRLAVCGIGNKTSSNIVYVGERIAVMPCQKKSTLFLFLKKICCKVNSPAMLLFSSQTIIPSKFRYIL